MKNEELEKAAYRYAELVTLIAEGERRVSEAQNAVSSLRTERDKWRINMKQFVGKNIQRKCVVLTGGRVLVVEWLSDTSDPGVMVFDGEGLEIRS